jgi:hypothetical protein
VYLFDKGRCILYPVWLNRRHKREMFTKMSNSRSSGYPLVDVTKYGVDGVISLNCLVYSWVRWSLILNFLFILPFEREMCPWAISKYFGD